jgi:membrane dipeptidase
MNVNTVSSFPVFDGHNDTLMDLFITRSHGEWSFFDRNDHGHLDAPRAKQGGFSGGLFAIMVPPEHGPEEPDLPVRNYDFPEFPAMPISDVQQGVIRAMAGLYRLETESAGAMRIALAPGDIRECLKSGTLAAGIHFEGAEPIDPELNALQVFYRAGLRSLGVVWSRPNVFGNGVPIRFPGSPDTGSGLTSAGRDLVRECNRLGILVDVSHLNYRGFMDVAGISNRPMVATHSNVHAICPCSRNLTDEQLDLIAASNGLAGINFAVGFLRPDGALDPQTPVDVIADHIEYIAARTGVDHVAIGSDFDGALIPAELKDVTGLPKVFECLAARGFGAVDLEKIAYRNWLRVLDATWLDG